MLSTTIEFCLTKGGRETECLSLSVFFRGLGTTTAVDKKTLDSVAAMLAPQDCRVTLTHYIADWGQGT